jgi:hypothetical protein
MVLRPMSQMGQIEKNSVRAYVFRFALELGHCSTLSACLKGAKSRHSKSWRSTRDGHSETRRITRSLDAIARISRLFSGLHQTFHRRVKHHSDRLHGVLSKASTAAATMFL